MRASWKATLTWLVVVLALAGAFALYGAPELAMALANQVWACF